MASSTTQSWYWVVQQGKTLTVMQGAQRPPLDVPAGTKTKVIAGQFPTAEQADRFIERRVRLAGAVRA